MSFTRANPLGWALFEELTSSQMNSLDADHADALDVVGGGAHNIGNPIVLTGAKWTFDNPVEVDDAAGSMTWLGTSLPKLESRSNVFYQPTSTAHDRNGKWFYSHITGFWSQIDASSDPELIFAFTNLPAIGTLVSVTVFLKGSGGHGALPASMPTAELYKRHLGILGSDPMDAIDSGTDASASVGAYEANHSIVLTPTSETFAIGDQYHVALAGEFGANSQTGLAVQSVQAFVTYDTLGP